MSRKFNFTNGGIIHKLTYRIGRWAQSGRVMMLKRLLALSGVVMLAAASPSGAQIVNGGFELGVNPGSSYTTLTPGDSTSITGWTVLPLGVDYIGGYWQAGEGNRSVDLGGDARGGLFQDVLLQAGKSYIVSFLGAANPDSLKPNPRSVTFSAGTYNQAFGFALNGTETSTNMQWKTFTTDRFTAAPGGTTRISFLGGNTGSTGAFGFALDGVSLNLVPEPATWAMMLLGFFAAGSMMRRRRNSMSVSYA